jgi:hypothetical protein
MKVTRIVILVEAAAAAAAAVRVPAAVLWSRNSSRKPSIGHSLINITRCALHDLDWLQLLAFVLLKKIQAIH